MKVLLATVVTVAVAFFSLFTSTAKVLPHIFHAYVLLYALILGGYATLYSALLDKTSDERRIGDKGRIIALVWAVTLLFFTFFIGSWDYIRLRNTRSEVRITGVSATILGLLFPLANLALVVLFFMDECYLEGVTLCFWLAMSILLSTHVLTSWVTHWKGRKYELRLDIANALELDDAINPASQAKFINAQNYQTDGNGNTYPWHELFGIRPRPKLQDNEQGKHQQGNQQEGDQGQARQEQGIH